MPNPVRIYVLHHPDSKQAKNLTNRIYEWFRLPSLEGIPVYVRSAAARGSDRPTLPYGLEHEQPVLEYLIPLVDARMVRDPVWHDYLTELAKRCDRSEQGPRWGCRGVLLPVALDGTAFNLPPILSRRNFIRHGTEAIAPTLERDAREALEVSETLKHLTEALARDLDWRVFAKSPSPRERFKIFISYARADGTDIARALRNYIQSETQCLAFLDENDISYGQPFQESIRRNVEGLARAMVVVNSARYADRSWCRWEIDRFTTAQFVRTRPLRGSGKRPGVHCFHPVLVVDAIEGDGITRVIPELAQAPMIRWHESRARLCFSTLMREVLLGLRDLRVAQQVFREEVDSRSAIFVNRLPSPAAIERLLRPAPSSRHRPPAPGTIRYPGYGMSLIELRLLRKSFGDVQFRAFRDVLPASDGRKGRHSASLDQMRRELDRIEKEGATALPLRGKVISISSAHCAGDLAAIGALPQHQDEAIIHLLRPLLRLGADLSYGGLPPKESTKGRPETEPSATRNITVALLRLISEERREEPETAGHGKHQPRGSLLFNVCAWPRYENITPEDEAAWINSYHILRFDPIKAGLRAWPHFVPAPGETPPPGYLRHAALTTSGVRAGCGKGFKFRLPDLGVRTIKPSAFIFVGGKTSGFSGIMPGIMEEFVHAARTGRPMYLFGGLGGATGVIARALSDPDSAPCPAELKLDHYLDQKATAKHNDFQTLYAELEDNDPGPENYFKELWSLVQKHRKDSLDKLFNNGLSHEDNKLLLTTENTLEAIRLTWAGLSEKLLRTPTAG